MSTLKLSQIRGRNIQITVGNDKNTVSSNDAKISLCDAVTMKSDLNLSDRGILKLAASYQ